VVAEAEGDVTLKRIVLDYRSGEVVVRVLYRSSLDAPNAGTKARTREVTELARSGLRDALEALGGDVTVCGTSGYTTREDLLVVDTKDATIAEEGSAA
jgi:hypothetical protein